MAMQNLQPQLKAIQARYAGNQVCLVWLELQSWIYIYALVPGICLHNAVIYCTYAFLNEIVLILSFQAQFFLLISDLLLLHNSY